MGVVNWDIEGDFQMDSSLQTLEIAFDNAATFLGNPEKMISGGIDAFLVAFLKNFDEDEDGIPDYLQKKVTFSDYQRMENDLELVKKVVEELDITELPDARAINIVVYTRVSSTILYFSRSLLCKIFTMLCFKNR